MGGPALEFFGLAGLYKKKSTYTSTRNRLYYYNQIPLIITYHPEIGDVDHGFHTDMLTDVAGAVRVYRTGSLAPKYGSNYRYVSDFSELILEIRKRYAAGDGRAIDCTFDLETLDLDPYHLGDKNRPPAHIISVSFTIEEGQADVVRFYTCGESKVRLAEGTILWEQINWIHNSPMVFIKGANLKFDFHWMAVHTGIECTNFVFDSTLVGSLLDENRSNGLQVHTKIYAPEMGGYDDHLNTTYDKGRMDLIPDEDFLPYAGGDTDAEFRVQKTLRSELLADEPLTKFYIHILHPASRAFEMVERGGVHIDQDRYKDLGFQLEQDLDRLLTKAKAILGGRLVAKHYDGDRFGGLNLSKPSLIKDFMFSPMGLNLKPKMFTEKSKEPSTAFDHLVMFKEVPEAAEFVQIYDEYGSTAKTYDTYYNGFRVFIRSDGRFHPTYWLFAGDKKVDEGGTVTGRLSAKDPAFQTLIKHSKWAKPLRRCFTAPPGFLVMERDYSQGELRVVACIAHEPNMIKAYRGGKDLHIQTAAPFAGHTYDSLLALKKVDKELFDETRQLGKAGNFGLVYGMQVDGFIAYALVTYGVKLSWQEGFDFRESYFKTYAGLTVYHKEYIEFAHKYGFVRSPLGRIRHLPLINSKSSEHRSKAERQAINSPVQSTLSDMLIWSMAIEHAQGLTKKHPNFGMTHDSANNYIMEDNPIETVKQHIEIQQNLPFEQIGWQPELQFIADAKIGPSMGELEEVKL